MPSFFAEDQEVTDQAIPSEAEVPAYWLAADNHNLGNSGGSWLSPQSWATSFQNAGRFISVSMLSGANGFYNTGIAVKNWFGKETDMRDTEQWITALDSDLGQYYSENRESADLAGFVAGSFVPGLAGVRALNAGQAALRAASSAGSVGANMSRATRLLAPVTDDYVKLASAEIARTNATFSLINANVTKALGTGVYQNVLEGAAFEVAALATQFKSPFLENQDTGDIMFNVALGAGLGGVIGGAFEAARTVSSIKKAVRAEDLLTKQQTGRFQSVDAAPASQKIILQAMDRDVTPPVIRQTDDVELIAKDQRNYEVKVERANNEIRAQTHVMTLGAARTEIANAVADTLHNMPARTTMENLLHATEIGSLREVLPTETAIKKALKEFDYAAAEGLSVRYLRLGGERAGEVTIYSPSVVPLSDALVPRRGLSVADTVKDFVAAQKFKIDQLWDSLSLTGARANQAAEARYIWARDNMPDLVELAAKRKQNIKVHMNDIPVMEAAFERASYSVISIVDDAGKVLAMPKSSTEMYEIIKETKERVATALLERMVGTNKGAAALPAEGGTELISRITNTTQRYLEGTRNPFDEYSDLFKHQGDTEAYMKRLKDKGLPVPKNKDGSLNRDKIDSLLQPNYAKIGYSTPPEMSAINGHVMDGMTWLKQQQKLFQENADRVFAVHAPKLIGQTPELTDQMLAGANRFGGGAGVVTFAAGGYGTIESAVQAIGSQVTRTLKEEYKATAKNELNSALVKLSQDTKAAIEFDVLNQKLAASKEFYNLVDDASEYGGPSGPAFILEKLKKSIDSDTDVEDLLGDVDEFLPIRNTATYEAWQSHLNVDARHVNINRDIRAAQGKTDVKSPDRVRPIRPSPADYPHFAFVKDPRVTETGHTSMIHAASESELAQLMSKVPPGYKVITKDQAEDFARARQEYDINRTLHENYIDSDLRGRGVNSQFFPKTDPEKIANDILNHHLRQADVTAVELVRLKYQPQLDWLEDQGSLYSSLEASRYGATLSRVEKFEKNPYISYVKTALDVSRLSEYPLLFSLNKALDKATSRVVSKIGEIWTAAKTPADLELINSELKASGYNTAYYDAALELYANHPAPKGELTKFVRGANAILSRFVLGLDPLNALNNLIGANVLRGTELGLITRAIREGNTDLAGKLADLSKTALPGVGDSILTPSKLVARALQNFVSPQSAGLVERYKQAGYIRNITEQFRSILDDVTLQGTETVTDLNTKIGRAFEKARAIGDRGEKLTGNTFAEEFNRFISADVMRQITDLAVDARLMTPREASTYINTFVNRVEGNIIATQRPLIFQGPIGQAVGLFQSYQFNLLQNLFRYVGEGKRKDVATLLGLQGTFYGLNGMPAFSFINQHIVGTASGNDQHRDLYDATYGIAGREAGQFLLYGAPSYMLQGNIYSRGDINPRHVTIVPTSIADVPFVGGITKLFNSVKQTATNLNQGASIWESLLQGLEHNGVSRPLAGMAQVAQGLQDGTVYSTSKRGTVMGQNDLLSWASLIRVAGGRPLDEAVTNDAVFRITSYNAVDRERKLKLAQAVKTSVIAGGVPSEEQVAQFAEQYAVLGGKQSQFNRWMMEQYKKANTSQSWEIQKQLSNPLSYKAQLLMDGIDP